mgnify:CR=1 FL=1
MKTKIAIKGYPKGSTIPGQINFDKTRKKFQVRSKIDPKTDKRKSCLVKTETEAILILLELNKFIDSGDTKTDSVTSLKELSEYYFENRLLQDVPQGFILAETLETQKDKIAPLLREYGFMKLNMITESKLLELRAFIVNYKYRDKFPTQATIEDKIEILFLILEFAIKKSMFSNEVRTIIEEVKKSNRFVKSKVQDKKAHVFQKHEIKEIFDTLDKYIPTLGLLARVQYYLGLRCEEVLGLKWENFDSKNNILYIRNVVTKSGFKVITKTKKSARDLYIPNILFNCLKKFEEENLDTISKDDLIFQPKFFYKRNYKKTAPVIKFISSDKIGAIYRKLFKNTSLSGKVKTHNFRHTFATNAADNGVTIEKLSNLLGHENIQTTMIYYEISPEQIKNSILTLDKFYNL